MKRNIIAAALLMLTINAYGQSNSKPIYDTAKFIEFYNRLEKLSKESTANNKPVCSSTEQTRICKFTDQKGDQFSINVKLDEKRKIAYLSSLISRKNEDNNSYRKHGLLDENFDGIPEIFFRSNPKDLDAPLLNFRIDPKIIPDIIFVGEFFHGLYAFKLPEE